MSLYTHMDFYSHASCINSSLVRFTFVRRDLRSVFRGLYKRKLMEFMEFGIVEL